MTRLNVSTALIVGVFMLSACSGKNNPNPTGPSPTPTPTPTPGVSVRAVTLTSTLMSPGTFQLRARAEMSDGSTPDVTMLSKWSTSNANIAVINDAGLLRGVGSGQVEVRAIYQDVSGAMNMAVSEAPMLTLTGAAMEAAPATKPVAGLRVEIVDGPDAGKVATTDNLGMFRFENLQGGLIGLTATRDGYQPWKVANLTLDQTLQLELTIYPTPPRDANGANPSARCKDGSWTWDRSPETACAANGGTAYPVCPGPMCALTR